MRDSPEDKKRLIEKLKVKLTPETIAGANKSQGRVIFEKTCASCHTLYGNGGRIGPDLTGSGRDNLDYLLENIIDPSGVVSVDFHMSIVDLKDGRTLNGLLSAKTDRTITLKTINETLTLERSSIESIRESELSLMPEGLLDNLSETEVRDLIGYLMSPSQAP
ncbi:MAG: c-type cytochrome [Verrucomicrobiota bacterium]